MFFTWSFGQLQLLLYHSVALFGTWTVGALTTGAGDVEQVCRLGTMAMSKVLVEEEGPLSGYMSIIPYNKCSGCEIMSPIYKKLKTNSYMSIVSENEKWFSLKTTCLWFYFFSFKDTRIFFFFLVKKKKKFSLYVFTTLH